MLGLALSLMLQTSVVCGGATWTLASDGHTIRNGVPVNGLGFEYVCSADGTTTYVLGFNSTGGPGNWYRWDGQQWVDAGPTRPVDGDNPPPKGPLTLMWDYPNASLDFITNYLLDWRLQTASMWTRVNVGNVYTYVFTSPDKTKTYCFRFYAQNLYKDPTDGVVKIGISPMPSNEVCGMEGTLLWSIAPNAPTDLRIGP